jgi:hypothetical protein
MEETSKPSSNGFDRNLTVIFPPDIKPSMYLGNSCRFNKCELNTFEEVHNFVRDHFNVDFDIKYSGKDRINTKDLDSEETDYVAFLSIGNPKLSRRIIEYTKRGIPIIFMRYSPEMECETINTMTQQGECFKNRTKCGGLELTHCKNRFFETLTFGEEDVDATIPSIEDVFQLNNIPIFSMSFLIDFLIWYGNYGRTLRRIKENQIKSNVKVFPALTKAIADELAHKAEEKHKEKTL